MQTVGFNLMARLKCHSLLLVLTDCGNEFSLDNGQVDFTGKQTTYGETVLVTCNVGYSIHGTGHITCQADGSWGGNGECLIKGM